MRTSAVNIEGILKGIKIIEIQNKNKTIVTQVIIQTEKYRVVVLYFRQDMDREKAEKMLEKPIRFIEMLSGGLKEIYQTLELIEENNGCKETGFTRKYLDDLFKQYPFDDYFYDDHL